MKNLRRFALCFLAIAALGTAVATAQEISIPMPMSQQQRLMASVIMEPAIKGFFEKPRTGMLGLSFAMNPMFKKGFETEIGFTDEQLDSIQYRVKERFGDASTQEELENFGNLMQQIDERAKEIIENNGSIDDFVLSEEEAAILRNGFNFSYDKMSEVAQDVFTPEQMAKVAELEFAVFGGVGSPFLNIESMEILDLSEEQKKEIEEFQKEIESEKSELLDGITELTHKIVKTGKFNLQDGKNFEEKNKALAQKIGDRLREILTEEQLKKAEQIVKNQNAMVQKMLGGLGAGASWVPGANSWMPGQAIPDSLKSKEPQRKPRFPRAKKLDEETETVETTEDIDE